MNYEKLSKDEVFAQVELYKKAKVENVPEFKTKKEAVAWLVEQSTTLGTPHEVSQEDIDNNKEPELELELGEVVILPPLSAPQPTDPKTAEEVAAANASITNTAPTEETPVNVNGNELQHIGRPATEPVVKAPEQIRMYQGRQVISVTNKIHNGKVYIEVTTQDSVTLLSEAEFNQYVTPRQ